MTPQMAEITEVVETTGKNPFVTFMGGFQVVSDPKIKVGDKRIAGKKAFVSPDDYKNIRNFPAVDIVRAIKALKETNT